MRQWLFGRLQTGMPDLDRTMVQIPLRHCLHKQPHLLSRTHLDIKPQKFLHSGYTNLSPMDDEAFWNSDPQVLQDAEWTKISSDFTNVRPRPHPARTFLPP